MAAPGARVSLSARRGLLWLIALSAVLPAHLRAASADCVFAAYNLENYFQSTDFPALPGRKKLPSKSPEAIAAEVQVIAEIHPDVLGVCEMGPPPELESFRARLKEKGLDYPEVEFVSGPDPERHVALLSRYPIVARQSIPDAPYLLNGAEGKIRRGILDVTVDAGGTRLRFVGVHLKSKLKDTKEDEAELRGIEAQMVRQHADQAIDQNTAAGVIVYGDFNDTKNEHCIRDIEGTPNTAHALRDLYLKDAVGDTWTEYWKYADIYSRIDYIFVTTRLLPTVDWARSYVYRSPLWSKASDHRPVVAAFHLEGAR